VGTSGFYKIRDFGIYSAQLLLLGYSI